MPEFLIKSFSELSTFELHNIYRLRAEVFVVEQNCAYQDIDALDLQCFHLQLKKADQLLAYARIIAPDATHDFAKIGRVLTTAEVRKQALGKQLMEQAIAVCKNKFPKQAIVISAQAYLLDFYTKLGFKAEGEGYLEDNIPHIQMRLIHTT